MGVHNFFPCVWTVPFLCLGEYQGLHSSNQKRDESVLFLASLYRQYLSSVTPGTLGSEYRQIRKGMGVLNSNIGPLVRVIPSLYLIQAQGAASIRSETGWGSGELKSVQLPTHSFCTHLWMCGWGPPFLPPGPCGAPFRLAALADTAIDSSARQERRAPLNP